MPSKQTGTEPCPDCRSRGEDTAGDNLAVYDDGHKYCHKCAYRENGGGAPKQAAPPPRMGKLSNIQISPLPHRKIHQSTCERYKYYTADHEELGPVEIAQFVKDGKVIARQVRITKEKDFRYFGESSVPLWGQHLWTPKDDGENRHVCVTEGQIDAMSLWQSQSGDYPVVSIPNGVSTAADHIRANMEWLCKWKHVVLCFDSDEPGRRAARACAEILPPGKAKIANLRRKDANEYVLAGETKDLIQDIWNAEAYRPDDIMHIKDVTLDLSGEGITTYRWPCLTAKLLGRAQGDITMFTSGTGMGKSTLVREQIEADLDAGERVGVLMLEESVADTKADLIGLRINRPLRKAIAYQKLKQVDPAAAALLTPLEVDMALVRRGEEWLNSTNLHVYNHFGSLESNRLIAKLDFLAAGLGCTKLYLDHISMVISGQESRDERKDIDLLMTNLRSFVERRQVHLIAVSHLSTPDGKPFEEGGQISLKHLRGSRSIGQISDEVVALERDQQAEDEETRNTVTVRVLKARRAGTTGIAGRLHYDHATGRLRDTFTPVTQELEV